MNEDSSVTQEVSEQLEQETSAFIQFIESIDWQSLLINMVMTGIRILITVFFLWLLYKTAIYILNFLFERYENIQGELSSRYQTIYNVVENVIIGLVWFLAVYSILGLVGVPVGSLLAGAGVIGLAISLGAQGFVNDLITGLKILFDQQMDVGDSVVLDKISGTVQSVKLTTTTIRDFDGTIHFIPNREIIVVSNKSRSEMRVLIQIPLYPDTDFEQIRRVMNQASAEIVEDYPSITQEPGSVDFIPGGTNNSRPTAQVTMYTHPDDVFTVRNDAYERYIKALNDAGIDLPLFLVEQS